MNRYQIDIVNTYACSIAVDENEDHEPSLISVHTQRNDWPNNRCEIKYLRKRRVIGQVVHTLEV